MNKKLLLWIGIIFMPILVGLSISIQIQILPKVLHMLKNPYFLNFIYNSVSLDCFFIFLVSVIGVIILNIFDNLLKFLQKSIT
jgi:hypothetical protein